MLRAGGKAVPVSLSTRSRWLLAAVVSAMVALLVTTRGGDGRPE
ncbi:hypothetical protein [Amycolatopsis plumensis]